MMRVLEKLGKCSAGDIVTKRNGEKRYVVVEQVRIFGPDHPKHGPTMYKWLNHTLVQSLEPHQYGDFNALPNNTDVLVEVEIDGRE